jgi:hypothetical protein
VLSFTGCGGACTLTDALTSGLSAPTGFAVEGTDVWPTYESGQRRLTWSDTVPEGQEVTLRYTASITTGATETLINTAVLSSQGKGSTTAARSLPTPILATYR